MENKCECGEESEVVNADYPTTGEGQRMRTWKNGGYAGVQILLPWSQMMFQKAFFKALFEVKVEKLKKKIEEKWGSNLDQAPEAVIEASGKEWEAFRSNCPSQTRTSQQASGYTNSEKEVIKTFIPKQSYFGSPTYFFELFTPLV